MEFTQNTRCAENSSRQAFSSKALRFSRPRPFSPLPNTKIFWSQFPLAQALSHAAVRAAEHETSSPATVHAEGKRLPRARQARSWHLTRSGTAQPCRRRPRPESCCQKPHVWPVMSPPLSAASVSSVLPRLARLPHAFSPPVLAPGPFGSRPL